MVIAIVKISLVPSHLMASELISICEDENVCPKISGWLMGSLGLIGFSTSFPLVWTVDD